MRIGLVESVTAGIEILCNFSCQISSSSAIVPETLIQFGTSLFPLRVFFPAFKVFSSTAEFLVSGSESHPSDSSVGESMRKSYVCSLCCLGFRRNHTTT
jgi:hypothetical protein